ncbi:MAG TPA: DCC1-like thiol-disulfide oxidoreductase family protein [Anaeromyxobacteraceae bacterium]|nr:DCC1-like thiol-disulfide oxidoreductase family protein [Anaeromyxobacteraceae bacterium]
MEREGPIVLFDGVCNLCDAAVRFVIDRDPEARFRFAPLQSAAAAALLARHGRTAPATPEALVLLEGGRVWEGSDAALRIARGLRGPWRLAGGLGVVPRPAREAVYRWIARSRFRWFGRRDTCRVPSPGLRARFLAPAQPPRRAAPS